MTIDAMGCQRAIAQTILDKKADYLLALKGNQGTLRDDVELFVREQKAVAFKDTSVSQDTTVEGDHGRIETRTVTVFHDISWLENNHQWPGLLPLYLPGNGGLLAAVAHMAAEGCFPEGWLVQAEGVVGMP